MKNIWLEEQILIIFDFHLSFDSEKDHFLHSSHGYTTGDETKNGWNPKQVAERWIVLAGNKHPCKGTRMALLSVPVLLYDSLLHKPYIIEKTKART